jgi:hypothetical protein
MGGKFSKSLMCLSMLESLAFFYRNFDRSGFRQYPSFASTAVGKINMNQRKRRKAARNSFGQGNKKAFN